MNVEIKLTEPKLCAGCPCIGVSSFNYEMERCNLGYWDEADDKRWRDVEKRKRPIQCIKDHGR